MEASQQCYLQLRCNLARTPRCASPTRPSPTAPQERFPEYAFEDGEAGEPQASINNSRVQRELGLAITPVRETLQDMAATLIALGLAQPKPKA